MTSRAAWEAVADFWPRAATSQFVRAAELDFHVQVSGSGDDVLMLHGAGASSHSFAELAERLSTHYRVIAPDLPGQGFSSLLPTDAVGLVPFANYLESLLMTTLFEFYGFGLFDQISRSGLILVSTGICITLMIFSVLWLRCFSRGPMEWLWRTLAYLKAPSLKRG